MDTPDGRPEPADVDPIYRMLSLAQREPGICRESLRRAARQRNGQWFRDAVAYLLESGLLVETALARTWRGTTGRALGYRTSAAADKMLEHWRHATQRFPPRLVLDAAPPGLKVEARADRVVLKWGRVLGAAQYRVDITIGAGPLGSACESLTLVSTSLRLDRILTPGSYFARVTALTVEGERSPVSAALAVEIPQMRVNPARPHGRTQRPDP